MRTNSASGEPRPRAVNWGPAVAAVEALAHAAGPKAIPRLERLSRELLTPLCRIEELTAFATRAAEGDVRALRDLETLARQIGRARPDTDGLFRTFVESSASGRRKTGGCCGGAPGIDHVAPPPPLSADDVLSEAPLVEFLIAVMGISAVSPSFDRSQVFDAFALALLEAGPIVQAARAYRNAGVPGLAAHMRLLVSTNRLMAFASAGADEMWDFDGNPPPDLDHGPKLPRGVKPVWDTIGQLRRPLGSDDDYWLPHDPFEREPVQDFPPGWLALLDCLRRASELIAARAAIPPPAAPPRAVWTDGITGVDQTGPCVGDSIVIRGSGFAAIRATAVVLLPTYGGCRPVDVPAADWTDTAITVTVPAGTFSGPVGFADANYAAAYRKWAADQDRIADELRNLPCFLLAGPISIAPAFPTCPPDLAFNKIRAGAPVIHALTLNGLSPLFVEPGTALQLDWSVENAEKIDLNRNGSTGPAFAGAPTVTNPPGSSYALGVFTGDTPVTASYTLTATGPCGTATQYVEARLRKIPTLRIIGVEVTQGIQKFRSPDAPDNSIAVVASKDTAVRVYVAADNLNGFKPNFIDPDRINVTGELKVDGYWIKPTNPNQAIAQPESPQLRSATNNSLNFTIPAALAIGTKTLRVRAWTADELEAPPTGDGVYPVSPLHDHVVPWVTKRAYKVRYVRVSTPIAPAVSDCEARESVVRAFDLLPTPPLDIAPARLATWHTGQNLATEAGVHTLLGHIDDQHDCTLSEALFPWEDDCPDDDGAIWIAVIPINAPLYGGMSEPASLFDAGRNTVVVPSQDKVTAAHELGHTLKLNHVNVGYFPEDQRTFDHLPNGGAVLNDDVFDPHTMKKLFEGSVPLWDFMSYAGSLRWISPTNWNRLLTKF